MALFAFAFTFQADAQMKVKKFGISLGQDWDMCENPNLRVSLVLEPQRWSNVELHTSGVFIFNRVDEVYMQDYDNKGYSYADISMYSNEIGLEGVLLKKVPVFGWKALNLYGGIGTNAGYQFGNELYAQASQAQYEPDRTGSNGISARVFGQAGIGVTFFRRVELGLEGRYGAGFRHYFGTDTDFSNLHSVAVNLKYVLR